MSTRKAPTSNEVLQWLIANPGGAGCDDLAETLGTEHKTVETRMGNLAERKLVKGHRAPKGKAHSRKHWYALEHFPPPGAAPLFKPGKPKAKRIAAGQQTVGKLPPVTKCPGFTGAHRNEVVLTPGWQGAITQDWLERRAEST